MNKVFTKNGWADYVYWQTEDRKTLKKIKQLIEGISLPVGIIIPIHENDKRPADKLICPIYLTGAYQFVRRASAISSQFCLIHF